MLTIENITALRMLRQRFTDKASVEDYDELFGDMSPVPTVYWSCPGEPPVLSFRADFNDYDYNAARRATREIVKGRFQNGAIAYIEQSELALYAALYKKTPKRLSPVQNELIGLLEREGPMTIKLMKEMTGLLVKQITPELHKLQAAFIVFEDQIDNEWDRGWYLFKSEFPDIDLDQYNKSSALKTVLRRFAKRNVVFDEKMAASFYKLPLKEIKEALDGLVNDGEMTVYIEGFMLKSDFELLSGSDFDRLASVFVLHRNDFLVKSNEHLLKEKYTPKDYDVLQYILIDGTFQGAVIGRFKNGPFILEDILLDMTNADQRRDEIMEAVYQVNSRAYSPLKRFNGKGIV